jgi:hypothetical protein
MPSQEAGKDIVASTRPVADRYGDPIAFVEFFDRLSLGGLYRKRDDGEHDSGCSREHASPRLFAAAFLSFAVHPVFQSDARGFQ